MSEMNSEQIQTVAFQIILESGDARTNVHEAFGFMREGEFEQANEQLDVANEAIIRAHGSQTELLQNFANGQTFDMDILMVHSQDHLMTTMTLREVAIEMLHLYKKVN